MGLTRAQLKKLLAQVGAALRPPYSAPLAVFSLKLVPYISQALDEVLGACKAFCSTVRQCRRAAAAGSTRQTRENTV